MNAYRRLFYLFLIPAFLVSCSGTEQPKGPGAQQAAVPVVAGKAEKKDMPVQIHAVGAVDAVSTVVIKPQVGGLLLSVNFQEGQDVSKGDLLFTIDPRPYEAALAQAKANLAKDRAQAKTAHELADRYANLVQKDYVTKEQYDQVRTSAEALSASVEADLAAVETANLNLNYCTIRSPISGRTGNLMSYAGNVLKANETEMVKIHQMDPMDVTFSVPEENLADIRKYKSETNLHVLVTDKSGQNPVTGSLKFINNQVDPDTGTIQLKATFENKERVLWPGEFVNVTMTLTTRTGAVVVPAQAVESGQQGTYIYVIKPNKTAEVRPVTPGATVNQETIIEEGIEPGELVVTDGQLRLLPGATVEFKNAENPQ